MRSRLLPFLAILFFVPLTASGQEKIDNPYRNAKVGDYVAYKLTTTVGGKDFEVGLKQTVTAKSETEATVKTTTKFMGTDLPGSTDKIDLTKPFDITDTAGKQGKAAKAKFEKTGEGAEKIKIGDKTYDCKWIAGKLVGEAKGQKLDSEVKFWYTKEVPMSGLVKMEMKATIANVVMELSGSGNEK